MLYIEIVLGHLFLVLVASGLLHGHVQNADMKMVALPDHVVIVDINHRIKIKHAPSSSREEGGVFTNGR